MKKNLTYSLLLASVITISGCASVKSQASAPQPRKRDTASMQECGRGYVVGLWSNADDWDDWGVWLSTSGQSYDSSAKFYRAFSHALTSYNSGKAAYALVLAAQANRQLVAVFDDQGGSSRCSTEGSGSAAGKRFTSVQSWFK